MIASKSDNGAKDMSELHILSNPTVRIRNDNAHWIRFAGKHCVCQVEPPGTIFIFTFLRMDSDC